MARLVGLFIVVLILDTLLNVLSEKSLRGFEGKIVGGNAVSMELFPYSVQIFNLGSMCAGTILNGWVVLTAAHCFDLNINPSDIVIQVGSRYIYDFNAKQYNVAKIITHQKYNQTGLFACDIALMFVERRIEFNKVTQKAIIVNSKRWMNPKETNFTVNGWGWTKYGGEISMLGLMMTYLRFIPKQQCSKLHNMRMSADMFCLYGEGTRDTCKGDSGGGVFWKGLLVGIVSHGDGCAKKHKPSVYANVWHFKNWIKKKMMDYFDENCLYFQKYY